jgi:hypothetical protein
MTKHLASLNVINTEKEDFFKRRSKNENILQKVGPFTRRGYISLRLQASH